ncbi:MAG: C25 family cysteine peptidase [Saprospiraceae bacterium]
MRVTPTSKAFIALRLSGLFVWIMLSSQVRAQMISGTDTLLGNEWIQPGQSYFSFKVVEDGVYRISFGTLQNAGIPTASIPEDKYQLVHNGQEVPLRISGEYLEFVGQQNRGEIDAFLYEGGEADQLNPYYSLYTDTSVYYLTWGPGEHRRYSATQADAFEPASWFWQDVLVSFNTAYYKPYELNDADVKFAHYVPGEGYGASLRVTSSYTVETPDLYTGGPDPVLDAGFATRDEDHRILVQWNGMPLDTLHFNGLESRRLHYLLPSAKARNNIRIQGLAGNLDRHYLGFVNVRYPRAFTRLPEGWIRLDSFSNAQSVAVDSLQSRWAAWNPELGQYLEVNDSLLVFPSAPNSSSWYLGSMDSIRRIKSLMPASFSDLSTTGQLIFITHPAFLPEVEKYAAYRASSEGGGWTTTILNSEALINTFAYGIERHPLSIKNAIQAVARNSTEEHYIFLIGKSLEYPTKRNDPSLPVWLPSYGEPAGDNLLVARAFADVPTFPVGRLAVTEPGQILEYLQKVKTYEENQHTLPSTYEDRIWTKRILHLSGGGSVSDLTLLRSSLDAMANEAEHNLMGAEVQTISKENVEVQSISQTDEILNALNSGVLIKTYFGHGSVVTTQFVIDQATQLNNAGKNPMMYSLGCYTGNIHTPILSASENMVLHPSLGGIGYVATSGTGYISALSYFELTHYQLMGNEWYGAPIGKILQQTINAVVNQQNIPMRLIREEITYHGDPVIRLHTSQGPDYTFKPNSASVEPQLVTTTTDSFTVHITVANLGRAMADSVVLKIERQLPNGNMYTVFSEPVVAPAAEEGLSIRLPVGDATAGENQLYFTIDPDNGIPEWPTPDAENNNYYGSGFLFQILTESISLPIQKIVLLFHQKI